MKRKIIKQGHNTLTVTLPSDWVKKLGLSSGDELEMNEKDNGLFLSTDKKNNGKKSVEIDITGMDIPTIWKYFMSIYREGYDELKVKYPIGEQYESPYKFFTSHIVDIKYGKRSIQQSPIETIQQITNRFIGFEIIEHHKDYCVIKDMAEISSKEFDSSLRRVFLLIQQMAEEIFESIKINNTSSLSHTHDIDINVDKFHDYCIRVLNKSNFKDTKKSNILFSTLFILELVGDELKNISLHLTDDMKDKKLDNLLQLGEMVLEHYNKFYELYYSFSTERAVDMSKRDMEIYFYLEKLYKKKPGKKSELSDEELEIFNHFRRITRLLNALVELRIEMQY